jgi:hypothetical protein
LPKKLSNTNIIQNVPIRIIQNVPIRIIQNVPIRILRFETWVMYPAFENACANHSLTAWELFITGRDMSITLSEF